MTTRTKEPKCCCCGVRVGLGILFALYIIFGIYALAVGAFGQGAASLLGGLIGMYAVVKKSAKAATVSLILFILAELISLAFSIYYMAVVGQTVDMLIQNVQNNNTVGYTDEQIDTLRTSYKSSLLISYGVSMAIGIVITVLIAERMVAYRKWLKTKRNTFEDN